MAELQFWANRCSYFSLSTLRCKFSSSSLKISGLGIPGDGPPPGIGYLESSAEDIWRGLRCTCHTLLCASPIQGHISPLTFGGTHWTPSIPRVLRVELRLSGLCDKCFFLTEPFCWPRSCLPLAFSGLPVVPPLSQNLNGDQSVFYVLLWNLTLLPQSCFLRQPWLSRGVLWH